MKKLGEILLTILLLTTLVACSFGSEPKTDPSGDIGENEEQKSSSKKNKDVPKDTFDYVNGDTIELEVGTTIDESNIDEYILAYDYSNITIDDSKVGNFFLSNNIDAHDGAPDHYYEVSKYFPDTDSTTTLKLHIIWIDTQAPTCDNTDVYWYVYRLVEGEPNTIELNSTEDNWYIPIPIMEPEFLGLKDNGPQILPDEVFIDGRRIIDNDDEYYSGIKSKNLLDHANHITGEFEDMFLTTTPGDYEILLNVRDVGNNKASFTVMLHVVEDLSPEDKEILNAKGIGNDAIDSVIADLHNDFESNVKNDALGNHWTYNLEIK